MNEHKKLYTVLAVSLALNLFFVGFYAGKQMHRPKFLPFPFMTENFHHKGERGERMMPMHHDRMEGRADFRDDSMPPPPDMDREDGKDRGFDKNRREGFMERHHKKGFKSIFCGKVSDDVMNLEKEMLDKGRPLFEAQFKADRQIREELQTEFAKETLDMAKIKELFTKQTEGFINTQKEAQKFLLEMITKLPADKRIEAICIGQGDAFNQREKLDRRDDRQFKKQGERPRK